MDDADDRTYSRAPRLEDVARIERALHDSGARYVLIGGFAVIAHGGGRTTKDIDLLVDPAPENVALVRKALSILHDDAAADVRDTDVADYGVVRIADEVVVDLLSSACGVTWAEAAMDAFAFEVLGAPLIVASPRTLIRTKRTVRPSDAVDRTFLEGLADSGPADDDESGDE